MPPAIDYRQTFLRHHVPTELEPPFVWELGFREEILALDSLRHRLQRTFPNAPEEIHRLASRGRFFETMPDDKPWLYFPVRVRRLPDGDRGIPSGEEKDYDDLTNLLCSTAKSHRSVFLTARSGAGKSTAMLKAFFDCVIGRDPPLGGCLPCYLRSFSKARKGKSSGHQIILDLLAEASRLPSRPSNNQIEQWLTYSPPMLLFADLNTATYKLRARLSEAMIQFQEHFKKHRWIVAYRAADRDTALMNFQQSNWFGTYDLQPLKHEDALKYLRNLQRVESDLVNELGGSRASWGASPTTAPPLDAEALRRLFDRYGNHPDSLISTPLLMHFVSLIGIERAAKVESLAQLYAEVVEDYLKRDYGDVKGKPTTPYREIVSKSGLMNREGRTKIKVAMARVALAILAGSDTRLQPPDDGPDDTTVEDMLDDLLSKPEECRDPDWWPTDDWWHEGRYYAEPFEPPECRALREFSFLRRDGDTIGFLHDSFLYYFTALAVRCRLVPQLGSKLSSLKAKSVRIEWCRKAVERMHETPGPWRHPALFLGGMLSQEELKSLLPPLLTAEPAQGWFGVTSQMLRGRRRPVGEYDVVLRQVERALGSRATELEHYPEALFPHVYNHLSWCEEHPTGCEEPRTPCHTFACRILQPTMNATGRPWLRAETPMPPQNEEVFLFDSEVCCIAISGPGEFVTGHADGKVRRSRLEVGTCEILYSHKDEVHDVAVDVRDGTVLSGGRDGTIRCLRQGSAKEEILYARDDSMTAVAIEAQEGSLLWAEYSGKIWRLRPNAGEAELLYNTENLIRRFCYDRVVAIAVRPRDGAVLFSGKYGPVYILRRHRRKAKILYKHDGGFIRSVAVDARDGSVVSGGPNGEVLRLPWGENDVQSLYSHKMEEVLSVAVDPRSGVVLSGGSGGAVMFLREGATKAEVLYWHEAGVTALVVDTKDGAVLSGGSDKTVRRMRLSADGASRLYGSAGWITTVAINPRDGAVLAGSDDGAVVRYGSNGAEAERLYSHEGAVLSLAVDGQSGTVVSGGSDGKVLCKRSGEHEAEVFYCHKDWAIAATGGRRQDVAMSKGLVRQVREHIPDDLTFLFRRRPMPGSLSTDTLYRHEAWIGDVTVDAQDGSIVFVVNEKNKAERTARTNQEWVRSAVCQKEGMVCRLRHGTVNKLFEYECLKSEQEQINNIVLDARDGAVLLGAEDGRLYCIKENLKIGEMTTRVLHNLGCAVRSLAVPLEGGSLLFGSDDGTVLRLGLDARDSELLYRHIGRVWSVAAASDAGSCVSGGDDANLRLYRLLHRDLLMLLTPNSIRSIACSMRHNRIALALSDGRLVLVRVEPGVEALLNYQAQQKNSPPDASSQ